MTDNAIVSVAQATSALETIEAKKRAFIPLLRELVVNGHKLNDEQIMGRAAFAAVEGLDPITEVHTLVDGSGKTMAHTMSIGAKRRKNQEQVGPGNEITCSFKEMTPEELAKLPNAAIGFRCFVRDGQSYGLWQKRLLEVGKALREAMGQAVSFDQIISMVGPAPVSEGIGIFYKDEYNTYKDKSFNPIERCKKRAELNGRNHRFPSNAPVYEGENGAIVLDGQFKDAEPEQPAATTTTTTYTREQALSDLGYSIPESQQAELPIEQNAEPPIEQGRTWTEDEIIAAVVDAKAAPNPFSAKGALDKCKTGWETPAKAEAWLKVYRQGRNDKKTPDEAAEAANKAFADL